MKKKCFYCTKDERLTNLMQEICQLQTSIVYLFKDQKHRGRCIIAYKEHVEELFEIPQKEYAIYMKEVAFVAKKLKELFNADKINYAIYGDFVSHVHFHLVPKYKGMAEWGEPFNDKAEKQFLTTDEFETIRQTILRAIEE